MTVLVTASAESVRRRSEVRDTLPLERCKACRNWVSEVTENIMPSTGVMSGDDVKVVEDEDLPIRIDDVRGE